MIVSEIILPMQIMTNQLGLSRDPLMTVLDAYLEIWLSNMKGILNKGEPQEAMQVSEGQCIGKSPNGFLILERSNYPS